MTLKSKLGDHTRERLAAYLVHRELRRSIAKYPEPRADWHHAFALMDEERDELWDEVKAVKYENITNDDYLKALTEAIQVAAMAERFIIDLMPDLSLVELIRTKGDAAWLDPDLKATIKAFGYTLKRPEGSNK